MSAGEKYLLFRGMIFVVMNSWWTDKYKYRKPTRLPARIYIDYLMNWIVRLLEDDTIFPIVPSKRIDTKITPRCAVSERLPRKGKEYLSTYVPSVCPYLLQSYDTH